nr:unnamed protein product [Callosobruchus chinensis]
MTVFRILKKQLLYIHHLQRVQALSLRGFPNRLKFCNWMLEMIRRNPDFLKMIEFTEECSFSWDKIINFHNYHIICTDKNPHAIVETIKIEY